MSGLASTLSIPIAAVAAWLLGAVWYSVFSETWLGALGKTRAELVGATGKPSPLPFALSFAAELVMATVVAILVARLGMTSAAGGMSIGIMAWVGFVATTLGVNHAYTAAKPELSLIDGGHWLVVLLVIGFIVGGLA
ncbi:DUF1761 domain-containing protein [uncultured Enterovirga sp.]|uniref:DUF1761 domain-containing protein n=1 Tax=uncultured Enterovirga sp. TaxID=2026352 RepID=UPI0035C96D1A